MKQVHGEVVEADLIGKVLKGSYQVEEMIGYGGMAWVYRASHLQLGGNAAIKVLFSKLSRDDSKRRRFLQEARIQHQLSHPNIVRVQDIIEENDVSGFVMEWCNGGTLLHMLQKAGGPLSMNQLTDIFPAMVDAIGYAHKNGVVHRDLKPQNVLLHIAGASIQPKITDFGIAKTMGELGLTRTGEVMGTLEYASPEQLKDSKSVDQRSDIYSLGVLLYRMSTGRLPFTGSPARLIKDVLHMPPKTPENAPLQLHAIILKCLAKNPQERFASCDELSEAFSLATNSRASSNSLRVILPDQTRTEDLMAQSGSRTEDFAELAVTNQRSNEDPDTEPSPSYAATEPMHADPLLMASEHALGLSPQRSGGGQSWVTYLLLGAILALGLILFWFWWKP
ncbi:MAG: serine/threonine protein kinase [Deltaproteobacteria bacterium]|nr:MAG: serine/threonine protein kinase [Deltaproteobacteria bacterium]